MSDEQKKEIDNHLEQTFKRWKWRIAVFMLCIPVLGFVGTLIGDAWATALWAGKAKYAVERVPALDSVVSKHEEKLVAHDMMFHTIVTRIDAMDSNNARNFKSLNDNQQSLRHNLQKHEH